MYAQLTARNLILALTILLSAAFYAGAAAAQQEPRLPAPLENMRAEGAQMRYLGNTNGLDGWIAIKNGQEQYFYVTADGQSFLMGLLFDKDGKLETVRQVQALQQGSGADILDMFAGEQPAAVNAVSPAEGIEQLTAKTNREFKTPSEQLYADVESANWVTLGNKDAPYIYSFVDPQCPHCHSFISDLRKDFIDKGLIQVRLVPVGFRDDTRAQAAFMLAVPDPQKRWYAHLDGDQAALPVKADVNQQGVQRNLAVMQSWKIDVTPFTVYRGNDGAVKIVQGRVRDIAQIMKDIGKGS